MYKIVFDVDLPKRHALLPETINIKRSVSVSVSAGVVELRLVEACR